MGGMSAKVKRCKVCKEAFIPFRPLQCCCSAFCAIEKAQKDRIKKEAKDALETRRTHRAAVVKAKPRSYWMQRAQAAVNKYVRLRDSKFGCVSCDKPATWAGQWHASHYKSVGSSPALRFNLFNIHKSCSVCNNWKSGNIGNYRPELVRRIGLDKVEWLEGPHEPKKYTIQDLQAIRNKYVQLTKELTMKNKELMEELSRMNPEAEIIVFAEGKNYPTLETQILDNGTIEIGCGWAEIENDEDAI